MTSLIGLAIAINLLTWLMLWKYVEKDQSLIPIHYNIAIGIDRVGSWQEIMLFPGLGAVIIILNGLIAWLFRVETVLVRSVLFATVFIQLFILLGLGFLVLEFI